VANNLRAQAQQEAPGVQIPSVVCAPYHDSDRPTGDHCLNPWIGNLSSWSLRQ
jgi:hypothetical protein